MEKDSADKATTEIENSVTSEEQSSLAEKNDKEANEEVEKSSTKPPLSEEKKDAIAPEESINTDASSVIPETTDSENKILIEETSKASVAIGEEQVLVVAKETTGTGEEPNLDKPEKKKTVVSSEDHPDEADSGSKDNSKSEDKKGATKVPKSDGPEIKETAASPDNTTETSDAETKSSPKAEAHEDKEDFAEVDFSTYSKEDLVEVIKKLGKEENPFKADKILQKIAPLFNAIRSEERKKALDKFIADGGEADDFQMEKGELELRFDANYKLIKDKKSKKFKEQDKERSSNLVLAEDILKELREFMDSEESTASFNHFKAIQKKWKDLGEVPSQSSKTLWANYNALIHRFYDQRSIYFELKELDRKKNYEAKLELCAKAEALEKVDNLREAIKTLNDLHHEFKHMGPVPQEVQEELWQRFKAASDKVYDKRKAFVHELKAELHENQTKKEELIAKIQPFMEFDSDRIKEWNQKTKELLALQKEWDAIGGLPKEKAQEINRAFWRSFKKFFSNKHKFFKKLDADREENLIKKQALLEKALAIKDSEDWDKTANELKKIQNDWREIGPIPEKMRKKLFEDFKNACDQFFENRRKGMKSYQEQYKENLKLKKDIIKQIEQLIKDADNNLDKFNGLREKFAELGYVPKKDIVSIREKFQAAVAKYLNALTVLNIKEKTEISLETEFTDLAGGEHSESELYHKEQSVRRQISKLEDDIALWQNNLEFFAQSKSTDKLRKEVNEKISTAQNRLEGLRRQLKMLRSL